MSVGPNNPSSLRRWWPYLGGLLIAVVVVLVIVLSSGSSSQNTSSASVSDSGVGATVKIGIPIANQASLAALGQSTKGLPSVQQTELMFGAQIKAINAAGGIAGRKLQAVYGVYSLSDPATIERTCVALTQNDQVLAAVTTQFVLGGDTCVAQHGTPMFESVAAPQTTYVQYPGLIWTAQLEPNQNAKSFAAELIASGSLKGQKVGVLSDSLGGDFQPVSQTLLPALKAGGVDVAHVTDLSSDFSVMPQQIPAQIADMRSAGVSTIIDATPGPNLELWLGGLHKAGWSPKIVMSDLNDADFTVYTAAYPPSMQGTVAYTTQRYGESEAGIATPAVDQTCLKNYTSAGGTAWPTGSANYVQLEQSCQALAMLVDGLKAAGKGLTKQSLTKAMGSLGTVNLPFQGPSSFATGKASAADAVRATEFQTKSGQFVPTSAQWSTVSR